MFEITDFAPFLIPAIIGIYLVWLLWKSPVDPRRGSSAVQYEPPENLTPGECGALLENAVVVRLITATIVDLSVKGYLAIDRSSGEQSSDGQKDDKDYYFHLMKPLSEWKNLKKHEWQVASAIFIPTNPLQLVTESMADVQEAGGSNPLLSEMFAQVQSAMASPTLREFSERANTPQASAGLSELRNYFPLHLARIRKSVFDVLQSAGYYVRRPDQVRLLYTAAAFAVGLLIAVGGIFLGKAGAEPLPWILSGIISAVMIWGAGLVMPARSAAGVQALGKVLGFREYLSRVEKGPLEKLDDIPDLFEKYLPYAMALGVDTRWAEAFSSIAVPPPQWYRGTKIFFPVEFVNSLNTPESRQTE